MLAAMLAEGLPFSPGLQCLDIAWDTRRKRWFHLYPDEKFAPDDPLYWTGRYQTWNLMCAECHSTNLRKNYNLKTDSYRTTWAEINVGCQACHGPGAEHVASATTKESGTPMPVRFGAGDSRFQVEQCAVCHSRRRVVAPPDAPGQAFMDHYAPEWLRDDLYFADGQILGEVYVYGSFLQSKMYRQGVRCTDCHNPHSLKLDAEGNRVCTKCHQLTPPSEFPTLKAKNYDTPEHHHHAPGSEGARCVNCHMAARTYMVVDPRRDHSFRIPRPDLSVAIGTPNACNGCHQDKDAQWAAGTIASWNGPGYSPPPHFGAAL